MQIIENGVRVYGPYPGQKGRKHVILLSPDGSRKTKSFARFLMERFLGRELLKTEVVHHKDEDPLHDEIDNFEIVPVPVHWHHHSAHFLEAVQKHNKDRRGKFPHGTVYSFMKAKCTCDKCLAAKREWYDRRNASRRKGPKREDYGMPVECGTRKAYQRGCRCEKCRAANAAAERARRNNRP